MEESSQRWWLLDWSISATKETRQLMSFVHEVSKNSFFTVFPTNASRFPLVQAMWIAFSEMLQKKQHTFQSQDRASEKKLTYYQIHTFQCCTNRWKFCSNICYLVFIFLVQQGIRKPCNTNSIHTHVKNPNSFITNIYYTSEAYSFINSPSDQLELSFFFG